MPRYSGQFIAAEVPYGMARDALDGMTNERLIDMIPWPLVSGYPDLTELAWDSREPEHEMLPHLLRAQIQKDLQVLYGGYGDAMWNDYLASSQGGITGFPVLMVLTHDENGTDLDEDEQEMLADSNPVRRLTRLGICKAGPVVTITSTNDDLPEPSSRYRDLVDRIGAISTTIMPQFDTVATGPGWSTQWNTASTYQPPVAYLPPGAYQPLVSPRWPRIEIAEPADELHPDFPDFFDDDEPLDP